VPSLSRQAKLPYHHRMSLFTILILAMPTLDLLWWRWAHRRVQKRKAFRRALDIFMGAQLAGFFWIILGRLIFGRADEWLPQSIVAAIFIWHFLGLPLATLILLIEQPIAAIAKSRRQPASSESDAPTRRQFLQTAAIAAAPIATFAATGISLAEMTSFRVRRFDVALPQLPAALDGLTIAQVADIHVGRFASDNLLRQIVNETNALDADLVLLSGDLIDHSLADLPLGLDIVKQLKSRYGTFMCEGNHDLFESRSRFESIVKSSGVPLLVNETTTLHIRGVPVQLLGLEWGALTKSYFRDAQIATAMRDLLPKRDPAAFGILLAHHPHAFDLAADAGIPLTLSGHTHGGQLMLSDHIGVGPVLFRYWSGLYGKGSSKLIVSNGVGNWFPLRINAPAELLHITLRSAAIYA
jgi:predicted MPP superfamily phosphohydrolase